MPSESNDRLVPFPGANRNRVDSQEDQSSHIDKRELVLVAQRLGRLRGLTAPRRLHGPQALARIISTGRLPAPLLAAPQDEADLFLVAQQLGRLRELRATERLHGPRAVAQVMSTGRPAAPLLAAPLDEGDLFVVAQQLGRLRELRAPGRLHGQAPVSRILSERLAVRAIDRRRGLEWPYMAVRLAASFVIMFTAAYGAFEASATSLPDSPLYPVKLLVEDVQLATAPVDARPKIYVEQAARRVEETESLISSGRLPEAERTVEDATRRIASARAAVGQTSRSEVTQAIVATESRVRVAALALSNLGNSHTSVLVPSSSALPANLPVAPDTSAVTQSPGSSSAVSIVPPSSAGALSPAVSGGATSPVTDAAGQNLALVAPGNGDAVLNASQPAIAVIEAAPSAPAITTTGSVAAPLQTFSPLESSLSPATAVATTTATPVRSPTPQGERLPVAAPAGGATPISTGAR